jgi:hypothetical protein
MRVFLPVLHGNLAVLVCHSFFGHSARTPEEFVPQSRRTSTSQLAELCQFGNNPGDE